MIVSPSLSAKAETLAEQLGLSYDHLLGFRFAVNVLIATTIVWFSCGKLATAIPSGRSPRWWLPQTLSQRRHAGCSGAVSSTWRSAARLGSFFSLVGSGSQRMIPVALAVTVLISSYLVRVKTMWRQAPITAAVVIAAGLAGGSTTVGIGRGLHKVAEVLFGCVVGVLVSWLMSRVWLVRRPEERTGAG